MTDPLFLRRRVRWVLTTLPKPALGTPKEERRSISETYIFEKLRKPDFPDLKADELHAAMIWNLSHLYADFWRDGDEDQDLWALTDTGWRKEGLA